MSVRTFLHGRNDAARYSFCKGDLLPRIHPGARNAIPQPVPDPRRDPSTCRPGVCGSVSKQARLGHRRLVRSYEISPDVTFKLDISTTNKMRFHHRSGEEIGSARDQVNWACLSALIFKCQDAKFTFPDSFRPHVTSFQSRHVHCTVLGCPC